MPEPGNPQALNRYSYVYNNPVTRIDPTGHVADWDVGFFPTIARDPNSVSPVDARLAGELCTVYFQIYLNDNPSWVDWSDRMLRMTPREDVERMMPLWADIARADTSLVDIGAGVWTLYAAGGLARPSPSEGRKTWGQVQLAAGDGDAVYRYVGPQEAAVIMKTGQVPNTDKHGKPKDVSYTTQRYDSAAEAERGLLMGRFDPRGPSRPPTHRVTVLRNDPHWTYAGNSATNGPIELRTPDTVRALSVEPLK